MFGNNENLEYVLAHSNPHSGVRVELETEIRARKHPRSKLDAYGLSTEPFVKVLCTDIYHVVSDNYYLRSRDHIYIGDRNGNNETFRGNVKVPLVFPDYTPQTTPHMIEFTWDYSSEEFKEITETLNPVTVVTGAREVYYCDYPNPPGSAGPLIINFDYLHSFEGINTQFTEVSNEIKTFDEISFPEFKNLIMKIHSGKEDSESLLDFLSSHGSQKSFILNALHSADRNVRTFMNEELGVDRDLIEQRIYPTISLDLYGSNSDKTRQLDYPQKAYRPADLLHNPFGSL